MTKEILLDATHLRKVLAYDPETGTFIWRSNGKVAGSRDFKGYWVIGITVGGRLFVYKAHRLAWFYMTGEWPYPSVDHIDRVKNNNKFINLRLANASQNGGNAGLRKDNTSGVKGVNWYKSSNKWVAKIAVKGKRLSLGYFDSIDDASAAYERAAREHFGEFARMS